MRTDGLVSIAAAYPRFARERLAPALACTLLAAGCGGRPPATFVGESAHFRLYVDPALMPLPAAFAGDNALAALETQWSDVATMLKMPEGKIAYYWYHQDNIPDACGDSHVGGCTKEEEMEIDAPLLPDAHELNHAYTYMRAPRRPIPFLAEGIAEAIGCNEFPQTARLDADWPTAVAGIRSPDVYGEGGLFVRNLIRTQGIDAFLRYYEQSPERRDPALFGANFENFWGMRLDDFWTAIHTDMPAVQFFDRKICPCSLPALVPNAGLVDDPARAPYWTLPADLGGETIALTGRLYGPAAISDCSGATRSLFGKGLLARLDSTAGWYVPAYLTAAALDRFASERCEDTVPYTPPADITLSFPYVSLTVPAVATGSVLFIAIQVPEPVQVTGADEICDSCAFDSESCQPLAPNARVEVSGTFYARLRFNPTALEQQVGLVTRELRFYE